MNKEKKLDVDYIGSGEALTEKEKKTISEYFSKKKKHKVLYVRRKQKAKALTEKI